MSDSVKIDQKLLLELKEGEEKAFVEIYDRYWKRLYNFGYQKLRKKEIVEGMVQEIFIDLWQRKQELEIHSGLASYLYSCIRHKVLNHYKAQTIREKHAIFEMAKGEKNSNSVEEEVLYKDLKSNIKKIVVDFPNQRKTAYELRFKKGLSYQEIATSMDISVSTVEKHLIKALKEIRYHLRYYFNLSWLILCLY